MSEADLSTSIAWMMDEVLGWEHYFPERAEALARLAIVAGRIGQHAHAERLVEKAVSNVLGYGWRKDLTLHTTLELIVNVHRAGLLDAWPLVQQVAPFVEAVQDATDGKETQHLPVFLFDIVREVVPDRAADYLLHLSKSEDWDNLERSLRVYVERGDLGDETIRALGRTASYVLP